jgi:hypothetical protein
MYLMMISTWEPNYEKEVRLRRVNWEWPAGVKVISEFYDLQGSRSIYVLDTDAKGLIATKAAWLDVVRFEIFPVYPVGVSKEQLMKT